MTFDEWWEAHLKTTSYDMRTLERDRVFAESVWDAAQEQLLRGLTSYGDQPFPPDSELEQEGTSDAS